MSRQIKFRAFDSILGEMIEIFPDVEIAALEDGNGWNVMQYTGLKDKNDKEIYEGDLLDHDGLYEVKYFLASFMATPLNQDFDVPQNFGTWQEHCEVIGSIYENPELLEDGNDE